MSYKTKQDILDVLEEHRGKDYMESVGDVRPYFVVKSNSQTWCWEISNETIVKSLVDGGSGWVFFDEAPVTPWEADRIELENLDYYYASAPSLPKANKLSIQ